MSPEEQKLVIGTGTQMWSEWTPTNKEIEYQVYPRLAAYAETGWTKHKNKSYNRFENNITNLLAYWKGKNYNLPSSNIYSNK